MILKCPECSTRFLVPDSAFGVKPRRVRCGKCRHEWMAEPPPPPPNPYLAMVDHEDEDQAAPEVPPAPSIPVTPLPAEPAPIPEGSNLPAKLGNRAAIRRGLIVLAVLLGLALIGGVGLYMSATGMPLFAASAAPQLAIEDVKTRYVDVLPADADSAAPAAPTENAPKAWALVVEGTIRNTSTRDVKLPPLILATKDSTGAVLNLYRPSVQMQSLAPGGVTSFTYTLNDISDKVAEVTVQFASGTDADAIAAKGAAPAKTETAPTAPEPAAPDTPPSTEKPGDGGH